MLLVINITKRVFLHMSQTLQTTIGISRPSGGRDTEYIEIRLRDEVSGIQFAKVKMNLEDFARAITGLSGVECTTEVVGLQNIGKKREYESASVFISDEDYENVTGAIKWGYRKEALGDWLVDNHNREGWYIDRYLGSQGSIKYVEGGKMLNFGYYRYV
jgi:hypothetical protein